MAMDGNGLGDDIADMILDVNAPADMKQLIKTMQENIYKRVIEEVKAATITIPAGSVIIAVTGGSGAPAVGTPNPSPIQCSIM